MLLSTRTLKLTDTMSREPYQRRPWSDADDPRSIERYLDPDEVPEDIILDLIHAHVVRAECIHCKHMDVYISHPNGPAGVDCSNPDCNEELYLGDV